LRGRGEQLEEQGRKLRVSEEELRAQTEELRITNTALEEKTVALRHRQDELEVARLDLERKAADLEQVSRYKSEFLANMSHELRTPLNSILILGQQLADNPEENLSDRQVEFAKTIHAAGTDLLNLISDILDLSKIESGTVTVENEDIPFQHLRETIERSFRHEAERRRLDFSVAFDADLGRAINTDSKRLLQIVKNLLSNAFKFTEKGGVSLHASVASSGWSPDHPVLSKAPMVVAIEVTDTGIGISGEKQKIVFEAFQQADAGTARKYGGTGLGLAISRELAGVLGGEIKLESKPGVGSTFTLYLPLKFTAPPERKPGAFTPQVEAVRGNMPLLHLAEEIEDDRAVLRPGELSLLIVEDDIHYAGMLRDLARTAGFRALVAQRGADALRLAADYLPTAITLDIFLPDMLGWTVLARLKQSPETRHIPVQIVTI
jgi:signal transduction histidine kinase